MKRILVALSLLASLFTNAQITHPTRETAWYPGEKVRVTWNTNNALGPDVVILLSSSENPFPGGELTHNWVYISADPVENNGSFLWTVPDSTTEDLTYRILLFGLPDQNLASDVFHVRFGRKRTLEPILAISKGRDVRLTWSGIYGHIYKIEESTNLRDWDARETIRASDEIIEATAPVSVGPHYFRITDITE